MTENQCIAFELSEKTQGTGTVLLNTRRRKKQDYGDFDMPLDPSRIVQIDVTKIRPNRAQPRVYFESNATIRLADSIRKYGILQPLTVRIAGKRKFFAKKENSDNNEISALGNSDNKKTNPQMEATDNCQSADGTYSSDVQFELVAGERRYRAALMLHLRSVPCIIIDADEKKSAELALIENLLREDLNIFETANAIGKLIKNFNLTQEEVAKRLSMSQSAVANKLRLLRFSNEERKMILSNGLTERHARALLKLDDAVKRISVMEHIVAYRLNVGATETYIDRLIEEAEHSQDCEITQRRKPIIKDIRLFYNSVDHAVDIVKAAGIEIQSKRHEDENGVIIEISIPNPRLKRETA